ARRIEELAQERARLRISISRIGETFAANLDRPALLELALKTAIDAVQGSFGRVSTRSDGEEPLCESARLGRLSGNEGVVLEAERSALGRGSLGEAAADGLAVASVALGVTGPDSRAHGLITVGRHG